MRAAIEPDFGLSIGRQCDLLNLARSSYYYQPNTAHSPEDVIIMHALDRLHTDSPFFGYRRLQAHLPDVLSDEEKAILPVNHKRVRRLMDVMGLETLYPKPNLSKHNPDHKVFPYLLRGVKITHNRQVYSTDITYIAMERGFMYLTAVIDWYSRCVLAWQLSNTLTIDFCLAVVEEAFSKYGKPEIFNTDQGSQYTSKKFTSLILDNDVQLSMDGRGRALDNVFCERLWRTIKQEHIYIHVYDNGLNLHKGLSQYIDFYNNHRRHQSFNYKTPSQIFSLPL